LKFLARFSENNMPRSIRAEYAGTFYNVMAQGNRRQAIFGEGS
jgi:hypothetical protein